MTHTYTHTHTHTHTQAHIHTHTHTHIHTHTLLNRDRQREGDREREQASSVAPRQFAKFVGRAKRLGIHAETNERKKEKRKKDRTEIKNKPM